MSKKLLTRLLAFFMGAGLVLQPAVAYAAEPDAGDEEVFLEEAPEEVGIFVEDDDEPEAPTPDARIPITQIRTNSDFYDVLVYGYPCKDVTFEVANGVPVEITGFWVTETSLGSWNHYPKETFEAGNYMYEIDVAISDSYKDTYYFDDAVGFYVGDELWQRVYSGNPNEDVLFFSSHEVSLAQPSEKTNISSISVTSDYEDICKKGEPIRDISFELTEELPVELSGGWFTDVGNDIWATPTDKFFTSGKYQYEVEVKVLDKDADDFELDKNLTLTVNGKEWTRHKSKDDDYTIITFESEIIDLTTDQKIILKEAKANSDYQSIPKFGEPIKMPSFDLIEGKEITIEGEWYKQIGGMWSEISESEFSAGTYRFEADVRISDEYADTHELDRLFTLSVNNNAWSRLLSFGGFDNSFTYISENFVISEETPIIIEEGRWYTKYGKTYYEFANGEKAVGMQSIDGDYYLFSKKGVLQNNVFYEDDGLKYYFGEDGKLVKGWIKKWAAAYYADEEGVIQTGFVDIDGDTYYFDSKGKQKSSVWVDYNEKRYYIKANGIMAKAETITRWGKKYSFDETGALLAK